MPDWIKLGREQLTPEGVYARDRGLTQPQPEGQKPLVEIKLSSSGDSVVLRTMARIDRKRGGFFGIGHQFWRGLRWMFGINVKTIEKEQDEHDFDKGVDTLVEELAHGLMTKRDFFDKLDDIGKAGARLQATSARHSLGAPTSRELTQRFGDNLSLCLLGLRRESPKLFVEVMASLKHFSAALEKEMMFLNFTASIRNNHKSVITEDFNNRRATFHAYKTQIDALVEEHWSKPSAARPVEAAPQVSNEGRIN